METEKNSPQNIKETRFYIIITMQSIHDTHTQTRTCTRMFSNLSSAPLLQEGKLLHRDRLCFRFLKTGANVSPACVHPKIGCSFSQLWCFCDCLPAFEFQRCFNSLPQSPAPEGGGRRPRGRCPGTRQFLHSLGRPLRPSRRCQRGER